MEKLLGEMVWWVLWIWASWILEREVGVSSLVMRFFYVRLHTHAEYASMKLITCSEYFIRIHRSKKRSTGKQPLHIRTILFKFYFALLCNEILNYCCIKIYLGAFKKTGKRHVTRYFLAICHFGQILEHEKQF